MSQVGVEEPILSRYNGSFEMCSVVLLLPYNKGFLDLQLKFVKKISQANSGTPNCGMYKLLIATISSHWFCAEVHSRYLKDFSSHLTIMKGFNLPYVQNIKCYFVFLV